MTTDEAAKILDLPAGSDPTLARDRFIAARADLEKKIAEALTRGLQERYRRALATATEAYETLVMAAESGAAFQPPAAPAESAGLPTNGTIPVEPPSSWRRVGWHLKGMFRGLLAAVLGTLCLAFYTEVAAGTILRAPSDSWLWVTGILGFIVLPAVFMWRESVKASAGLPLRTARAIYAVLGPIAVFIGGATIGNYGTPEPAVVAALAPPPPAVAPTPRAAPVVSEPSPDVIALRGHKLATGSDGVTADPAKGLAMMQQAADRGSSLGMAYLEEAYTEGKIVPADTAAARLWEARKLNALANEWSAAADKGDAEAATNLASAYAAGQGVEQDPAKAVALWQQAAAGNNATAMFKLGEAYAAGAGVENDPALAREWLRKAADLGEKLAMEKLAKMDTAAKAAREGAALVAAAEARLAKTGNHGKLVSLAPGFAGWRGRRLQAPPSHSMLQASDVFIGMPFMRKRVGDRMVTDIGNAQAGLNRMIPATNLRQAHEESFRNSTTTLFSFFQDTKVVQQPDGFLARAGDLCDGVGLGWVVIVWVHDWGEGGEMKLGFGVVAGNATLDEGIVEAFKLAMDGFHKRGGRVARSGGIRAGVSAKIDFAQLRRDKLQLNDALMPFEYNFNGPGSEQDVRDRGFGWQMPENTQEFVRYVRQLTQASIKDWQRYQLTYGLTGFGNVPRAGLSEPVFLMEQVARPVASSDFRAWVAGLKVAAVKRGADPGLVIGQKLIRSGDEIDAGRGISLVEYDPATRVAVFEDGNKAIAGRRF